MPFIDLSIVELKDGSQGTIVLIYNDEAACMELTGEQQGQLIDISIADVKRVIWEPNQSNTKKR
ncbi:MAG: hypothetical protein J6S49_02220 [Erysipelotrichaceae bacterium]|nr:hypothetical protein [Erysipelotrichaceae bacterium]